MKKKSKSVASVSHFKESPVMIGVSDVIRWDDVMTIQGCEIKVSKAVELGIKHNLPFGALLEKDLKSETGLLLTFPMAMLMDQLQRIPEIGTGEKLLELVKA